MDASHVTNIAQRLKNGTTVSAASILLHTIYAFAVYPYILVTISIPIRVWWPTGYKGMYG